MKRTGFTLIEILVVIAIIASIIAIAIPNYLSARHRAQDIKIKTEMSELKKALRLYYNDVNSYPASRGTPGVPYLGMLMGCGTDGDAACPCTANGMDFAAGATCENLYMKTLPAGLGSTILYTRPGSTDDFCMTVLLNNLSDPDIATSQKRCAIACAGAPITKYWVCAD